MNLLQHVDIVRGLGLRTESTALASTFIDMSGFEGCVFVAMGSSKFNATKAYTMTVYGSTSAATTSQTTYGTVSSTANLPSTGSVDRKIMAIDCYKPEKRYLRLLMSSTATGASTDYINNVIAIKYGARKPGSSALNTSTSVWVSGVIIGSS